MSEIVCYSSPKSDQFYDWMDGLPRFHYVSAASAVLAISSEGFISCSYLGEGIWLFTDKIGRKYLRIFWCVNELKLFVPLVGSISDADTHSEDEKKLARLRAGLLTR